MTIRTLTFKIPTLEPELFQQISEKLDSTSELIFTSESRGLTSN